MKRLSQYLLITIVPLFMACDDFLTTPPLDNITDSQWWSNKNQIEMMVNGCYALTYGGTEVVERDCITDNGLRRSANMTLVGNGTHDTQNSYIKENWKYETIAKLNYVLEGIEDGRDNLTEQEYKEMKAQVKFIRALNYYDMIFFFGDIPLIEKTLTVSESYETSRQPRQTVLDFILNELENEILPDIETISLSERGRVNKHVVESFLARIYLHESNYEKVLTYTNRVIESNQYELYPNYDKLFRPQSDEDNNEVIFERQYSSPLYVHTLNRMLSPASSIYVGWSNVLAIQSMVDAYECVEGHAYHDCEALGCEYAQKRVDENTDRNRGEYLYRDPRFYATLMYPYSPWYSNGEVISYYGVDDPESADYVKNETHMSGYLCAKWMDWDGEYVDRTLSDKNLTIIRYADVMLMKAEALIEKNENLDVALGLINEIRERAGIPPVSYTSRDDLREKMRQERRVELAFEGLRYYDIIRWKIAPEVRTGKAMGAKLSAISETMENKFMEDRFWDNKMYLFPIPQEARDRNPNLTQNEGW